MAILTARQLTKQYAGEAHPALDHANLTIEQGEFVAIVGPWFRKVNLASFVRRD